MTAGRAVRAWPSSEGSRRPRLAAAAALRLLALVWCLLPHADARAQAVQERIAARGALAVCVWPGYPGISLRSPRSGELEGVDVEMAGQLATQLGVALRFVDTDFARIEADLEAGRCDVAMTGLARTPERAQRLAFAPAVLVSDDRVIVTRSSRVIREWSDIDRPRVRVGVVAGSAQHRHAARLRLAEVTVMRASTEVSEALQAGRIDAAFVSGVAAARLERQVDWVRVVASPEPLAPAAHAWAVARGDAQWLTVVSQFARQVQRDGRLREAAARHGLDGLLAPP